MAQMSTKGWVGKQIVVYSRNGTLPSGQKEQVIEKYNHTEEPERGQTQGYVIPCTEKSQKDKNHNNWNQISGSLGLQGGGVERGTDHEEARGSLFL